MFGKLKNDDDAAWAKANVRASWVLGAARLSSDALWCAGAQGLRKVEAALFMLGYGLPLLRGNRESLACGLGMET
ncbi:hypothetical protein ACKI2N_015440 [Cupriavidus sp. 30B13]|uniref:hypothetical protein n=1 Tax=Cupriavidus sp. 30B13 TaxID=3384241 RepID=UPI003CF61E2A